MKHLIYAGIAAAGMAFAAGGANAATFSGYTEVAPNFFDGFAAFDYDPFFLGGSLNDFTLDVTILLDPGLGGGSLNMEPASLLSGLLLDTMLTVDNGVLEDSFAMLFGLSSGPFSFAVATFTGDLDGMGTTDFEVDGVFFSFGHLNIGGFNTTPVNGAIPLPASLPLALAGLGGLAMLGRRRKQKS